MKRPKMPKIYNILPPGAINDNTAYTFVGSDGTNNHYVDCKGFRWARFIITLGALDIAFAVKPKVSEATAIDGTHEYRLHDSLLADRQRELGERCGIPPGPRLVLARTQPVDGDRLQHVARRRGIVRSSQ